MTHIGIVTSVVGGALCLFGMFGLLSVCVGPILGFFLGGMISMIDEPRDRPIFVGPKQAILRLLGVSLISGSLLLVGIALRSGW